MYSHSILRILPIVLSLTVVWTPLIAGAQEPSKRDVLLLGARNAWKSESYEKAISRYRSAIEREPAQWDAIAELGWLFIELGQHSEALEQFKALATLTLDNPLAARERIRGFMALRQLTRVDRELLALSPSSAAERWARFALADLRLQQMRYSEAEALYAYLALKDQSRDARVGLADVATATGNHQGAAEILNQLYAEFPQDTEIARRHVVNLANRQRVIEAFQKLEDIESEVLHQTLDAELRNIFGEHVHAGRLFEGLRARRPADYGLLIGSAEALRRQKNDQGSEVIYQTIVRHYPEDVRARVGLAEVLITERRFRDTETILQTLREDAPGNAPVQYGRVRLYLAQGRRALARDESKRMAGTIGSLAEATTIQKRMLEDGDFASVVAFSEGMLSRVLQNGQLLQRYLDSLIGTGQIERAKTVAAGVLRQAKARSTMRLVLARFYLASGNRAKAKDLLQHTTASTEVGSLYYDLKDYGESRHAYESVLKDDPANFAAAFGLARTLAAHGHSDHASELLRQLIERTPGRGHTAVGVLLAGVAGGTPEFYRLADGILATLAMKYPDNFDLQLARTTISLQGHQHQEAIARLRRLKEIKPESPLVALQLAKALSYAREINAASTAYDDYLQIKPYDVTARREKARAYGWAFEYERALTEYEQILTRFPDDTATALEREGKEALGRGRLRQARSAFDKLVELEPQNGETLFDLGQIATLGGRPSEAQAAYRQLMSVVPGHRQAELALELSELSQRPLLTLGYTYINQKGFDDKRSIKYGLATTEGRARLSDDVSTWFRYDNVRFQFDHQPLSANLSTWGSVYSPSNALHVDGFLTELHYNEIGRDRLNLGIGVSYHTLSGIRLRADFERKDLWENQTTVLDGITVNRLSASARGTFTRRIDWTLQGNYSNYSDKNAKIGGELTTSYQLLLFPRTLRLLYRLNTFGFQRERSYFSPNTYTTNTLALEYQHWFGYPTQEDYLAEAPRNHSTLYYGVSMDSSGELFHEWQGKLSYQFTRQIEIGPSLKIIRSQVYSEMNAMILIKYAF